MAEDRGAVFILRPDGTIRTICDLGDEKMVATYFERFVITKGDSAVLKTQDPRPQSIPTTGEVDLER